MLFDAGGILIKDKILTPYKGMCSPRESDVSPEYRSLPPPPSSLDRNLGYHLRELAFSADEILTPQALFNIRYSAAILSALIHMLPCLISRHSIKRSGSVECALGILKSRFRILKAPLEMKRENVHNTIYVCLLLLLVLLRIPYSHAPGSLLGVYSTSQLPRLDGPSIGG